MSLATRLALALLLAAGVAAVPHDPAPALADGDGDGEKGGGGGEGGGDDEKEPAGPDLEGEESAGRPTMDGAVEIGDARRHVSMKVPKEWKAVDGFEPEGDHLARFVGPVAEHVGGLIDILAAPYHARAALALGDRTSDPADLRSGPGWTEVGSTLQLGKQSVWCWERAIEKDGAVFLVRVYSPESRKDAARPLAKQMLDTAKIGAVPAKPAAPSGFTVKKAGDFDTWTDSEDKGKPAQVAEIAAEARGIIAKSLKGKPFDDSRPVLRIHQVGTGYVEAAKAVYGEPPENAAYEPVTHSVIVQLFRFDRPEFKPTVSEAAARQYVAQYFGGIPPLWIDVGLRRYAAIAVESGGQPGKPKNEHILAARGAAAKSTKRLDEWMGLTAGPSGKVDADAAAELWAWHMYFRHGGGSRKYGKQYQASLDALRQTGDAKAARKAWDGADFTAMGDEFRTWCLNWK